MPQISSFYGITIWMYYDEDRHREPRAAGGASPAAAEAPGAAMGGCAPGRAEGELAKGTDAQAAARHRAPEMTVYHRLMRSTPLLTEVAPADGYTVYVRFADGLSAEVDLSYLVDYGGIFRPLRDISYFRGLRADAEASTIVWPNGADVAPETLYARAQQAVP
jgi:Protein of unknown function (DUF2442)